MAIHGIKLIRPLSEAKTESIRKAAAVSAQKRREQKLLKYSERYPGVSPEVAAQIHLDGEKVGYTAGEQHGLKKGRAAGWHEGYVQGISERLRRTA
jgi:hypothetical protein